MVARSFVLFLIPSHGGAGKHFYIRNQQTGLVFTLKNSQLAPKTEVITCGRDITRKDYDSQSFYYDEMTNTIRASANDYCLEMLSTDAVSVGLNL